MEKFNPEQFEGNSGDPLGEEEAKRLLAEAEQRDHELAGKLLHKNDRPVYKLYEGEKEEEPPKNIIDLASRRAQEVEIDSDQAKGATEKSS